MSHSLRLAGSKTGAEVDMQIEIEMQTIGFLQQQVQKGKLALIKITGSEGKDKHKNSFDRAFARGCVPTKSTAYVQSDCRAIANSHVILCKVENGVLQLFVEACTWR